MNRMSKETIYREDVLRIIDRKTVRGKLQVAREVLKLPPADVQLDTKELVAKIKKGISATNADDVYSCGMRDGMRWCMSLVDDEEPLFENCPSAQPEPKTGHWIPYDQRFPWSNEYKCSECGNYLNFSGVNGGRGDANFCPSCGADMRQSNAD